VALGAVFSLMDGQLERGKAITGKGDIFGWLQCPAQGLNTEQLLLRKPSLIK
jgi:hypothetical protein